jgi:hypothetical protein
LGDGKQEQKEPKDEHQPRRTNATLSVEMH